MATPDYAAQFQQFLQQFPTSTPAGQQLTQMGYTFNPQSGGWVDMAGRPAGTSVGGESDNSAQVADLAQQATLGLDQYRNFFSSLGIAPLDPVNGMNITDAINSPQQQAQIAKAGGMDNWLNFISNGAGASIQNIPGIGQAIVSNNGSPLDPYRDMVGNTGGNFLDKAVNNFANSGGLVAALAGGIGGLAGSGLIGSGLDPAISAGASGNASIIGSSGADTLGGITDFSQLVDTPGASLSPGYTNATGSSLGTGSFTGAGTGAATMPYTAGGVGSTGLTNLLNPTNLATSGASEVAQNAVSNSPGSTAYDPNSPITEGNAPAGPGAGASVTGTAVPGAGAVTNAAMTAGAGSVLSRILDGTATTADWTSLGGTGLTTLLGYLGSNSQANAYQNVGNQQMALGAPYRDKLAASYAPGFTMANDPGYTNAINQTMDSYLRKASTGGNPFTNPGVSADALKYVDSNVALPQLNTYRSQLASQGQLGVNNAGTANMAAAQQAGGPYASVGAGIGQLTQDTNSQQLQQLLNAYQNIYKIGGAGVTT